MDICAKEESLFWKEMYLAEFIDTANQGYINTVQRLVSYSDGCFYTGYLWDYLKEKSVVSETVCNHWLQALNSHEFYLFWDNHSKDIIQIQDYWKFPKDSVLKLSRQEYCEHRDYLPEDIYLFDETFAWTICLTHEWLDKGKRYCLFAPAKYVSAFKETGRIPDFSGR